MKSLTKLVVAILCIQFVSAGPLENTERPVTLGVPPEISTLDTTVLPPNTTVITTTTTATTTTTKPTPTPAPITTSTSTPTTNNSTTATTTTTKLPPTTTSTSTPTTNNSTTTPITTTTTVAPAPRKNSFDGPSFIGGIVLSLGLVAIGFVGWKYHVARNERNYRTL